MRLRGRDHVWEIRKYKIDSAYYMHCSCGFEHACHTQYADNDGVWHISNSVFATYNYCPNCGARKKYETGVKHFDDAPPWMR